MGKINNYYVGKKIRDVTNTPNKSFELQDTILPVVITNPSNAPGEVQPCFPKPNTTQRLRLYLLRNTTSSTDYQVATVSATTNIYFVGAYVVQDGSTAAGIDIYDATSGSSPTINAGTPVTDSYLYKVSLKATTGDTAVSNNPLPIKCNSGIRMTTGGASQNVVIEIQYIEETIVNY